MFGLSPLPRTLGAALRDVSEKKLEVRISAVRDLGRLAREASAASKPKDRESALLALEKALRSDTAVAVRSEAAIAIADAQGHEAAESLMNAISEDEAIRVRQMALVALGEVVTTGDENAKGVILDALADESPELRFQALIALSRVARPAAEDAVYEAMSDADAHIRYVAYRLAEERWVDDEGVKLPARLLERARDALDDGAAEVRLAAAILLGRSGDTSGAGRIVDAINSGTGAHEPEDLSAAIELAGTLGLKEARAGLERRAFGFLGVWGDNFAWQARVALAELGDERARRVIVRGLSAWTRDARTMAVAAAGRARLAEARGIIEAMRGEPGRAEPDAVTEALARLSG